MSRPDVEVDGLDVAAYTVGTDEPESDGTLEWDSTTIVVVHARGGFDTVSVPVGSTAPGTGDGDGDGEPPTLGTEPGEPSRTPSGGYR